MTTHADTAKREVHTAFVGTVPLSYCGTAPTGSWQQTRMGPSIGLTHRGLGPSGRAELVAPRSAESRGVPLAPNRHCSLERRIAPLPS